MQREGAQNRPFFTCVVSAAPKIYYTELLVFRTCREDRLINSPTRLSTQACRICIPLYFAEFLTWSQNFCKPISVVSFSYCFRNCFIGVHTDKTYIYIYISSYMGAWKCQIPSTFLASHAAVYFMCLGPVRPSVISFVVIVISRDSFLNVISKLNYTNLYTLQSLIMIAEVVEHTQIAWWQCLYGVLSFTVLFIPGLWWKNTIFWKMMQLLAHMLSNLQYHELCFQETKPVVNEAHEPRLCGHVVWLI